MKRLPGVLAAVYLLLIAWSAPATALGLRLATISPFTCDGTNCTLASGQLILPNAENAIVFGTTLKTIEGSGGAMLFKANNISAVSLRGGGGSDFLGWNLRNDGTVSWSSTTSPDGAPDLLVGRQGAANLRQGAADAAAPVSQYLSVQNVATGTANTAGVDRYIDGSQGTGTGVGGSIVVRTAPAGGAGSAQNALATLLTIGPANVTLASGQFVFVSGVGLQKVAAGALDVTDGSTGRGYLGGGLRTYIGSYGIGLGQAPNASYNTLTSAGSIVLTPAASPDGVTIDAGYGMKIALGGLALSGTGTPTSPAVTFGSGTGLTVVAGADVRRTTHKVTVTYAALAAAALTADKTIATLPAKTRLVGIVADTTTPYTGGGVTAATLIAGKSVGGNEYLVSHDVFTAAITKGNADSDLGTSMNRANAVQGGDLPSWTGTTVISVRLTTVTANTNQLTAGSTTYYITTEVMP